MRLPVLQMLLLFYLALTVIIGIKIKRRSSWVFVAVTLAVFTVSVYNYFSALPSPVPRDVFAFERLASIQFIYIFILFPIVMIVEAVRLREKPVIYSALFSSLVTIIFAGLFSMSGM